jgi:hypothetical protein
VQHIEQKGFKVKVCGGIVGNRGQTQNPVDPP